MLLHSEAQQITVDLTFIEGLWDFFFFFSQKIRDVLWCPQTSLSPRCAEALTTYLLSRLFSEHARELLDARSIDELLVFLSPVLF